MTLTTKTKQDIQRASDSADRIHPGWSEIAFKFLKKFLRKNPSFMIEDVRYASQGIVPKPKSERAWGSVAIRAKGEGLIKRARYKPTKNINANQALASVWHRV